MQFFPSYIVLSSNFHAQANLRLPSSFIEEAQTREKRSEWIEAVRCYLLGHDQAKAIRIGLDFMKGKLAVKSRPVHHAMTCANCVSRVVFFIDYCYFV